MILLDCTHHLNMILLDLFMIFTISYHDLTKIWYDHAKTTHDLASLYVWSYHYCTRSFHDFSKVFPRSFHDFTRSFHELYKILPWFSRFSYFHAKILEDHAKILIRFRQDILAVSLQVQAEIMASILQDLA